jgi:hypothetical protein
MNPEGENLVQKILSAIDSLANGKINFRDDLERIINIALTSEKLSTLEEIAFHAKIAYGVFQIIQRKEKIVDEEFANKAASEYKVSIVKIKLLLNNLLGNNNSFIKNIFTEKYFQLSQKNLSNLNGLCSDLSYLKLYFNDKKREIN